MQSEATRLMTAAKHGDREAFDRLVAAVRGQAFHVARGLVGSRDDAMDLSQEAFLRTFRARATYRDGEPFLPWFHRILRNVCYTHLRRKGKVAQTSLSPRFGDAGAEDDFDWEIADQGAQPEEVALQGERARLFWSGFHTLSARDREILALRHFRELAYQEIADALGIPVGTVMSRLFHARRRLRERLAGVLDEDAEAGEPARAAGGDPREIGA